MDLRQSSVVLARALALLALSVSAALVVEYASPEPLLCGAGGGCTAVRACWEQRVRGFSLPWFGLVTFGLALVATLVTPKAHARRVLGSLALGSVVGGVTLLLVQRGLCGAWCKLCVITDGSAIGFGAALWYGREKYEPASDAQRWLFGGGAVLAATVALALAPTPGPGATPDGGPDRGPEPTRVAVLPGPIAREQRAGQVTLVEFADFECPFCRRQHDVLTRVLPRYEGRVRFVRKQLPLTSIHPHAEAAALAALCAEDQGRGEPMADKLFRADVERLTPEGTESLARDVAVDLAPFRACVRDERTRSRLAADRNAASESGVTGLPTMFVGGERFEGLVEEAALRASIERALAADAGTPTQAPALAAEGLAPGTDAAQVVDAAAPGP